jgi:ribose 5-phosphate isomerase B
MRITIASDHAAVELRQSVVKRLVELGHVVDDLGCAPGERVDYPRYAAAVCAAVMQGAADRGILLCGTGIGMSIAANKIVGIRAALVHDVTTARLSAEHNHANVLCLGGRTTGPLVIQECIEIWLATPFDPRHQARLDLISLME